MTFDLSTLEIIDTGTYQVVDARGNDVQVEGQPFTITVASPGTKKAVNARFKREEARSARVIGMAGGVKSKRTAEDEMRERADFLMAITEGVTITSLTYKGQVGTAALRAMYLEPKLQFIADGVEKFHSDMGNFAPDSATASSNTSDTSLG